MLLALGLAGGSVRAAAPGPNPGPISPCIPMPQPIGHPPPKAGDIDVWFGCLGSSVYSASNIDVQIRALAIQPGDKRVTMVDDPLLEGDHVRRREVKFRDMADVGAKKRTLQRIIAAWAADMSAS